MSITRFLVNRGFVLVALLCLPACSNTGKVERKLTPSAVLLNEKSSHAYRLGRATNLKRGSPYLKAHMLNGQTYILSDEEIDIDARIVEGSGVLLSLNRDTLEKGAFTIPLDSVALFETNVIRNSGPVTALAVVTGASVALTAYCAANPKACFGSCPTFYVSDGDSLRLQAEGFSSSIAPSLEARDVDALYRAQAGGLSVQVQMRNEALETHVVRYVNLLAAPAPQRGRVLADVDGSFWYTPTLREPRACSADEGDCLPLVRAFDDLERFSQADSTDLAAREVIELTFDVPPERHLGLVVGVRQTLLTTYLFYQAMAYMGRDVSAWLA
ncbi:MAG TPA: hypothetical protein VFG50_06845, partial [Rhodothermales bacterium]|nr:hypothetical protein [Rhodothermales bacterium]